MAPHRFVVTAKKDEYRAQESVFAAQDVRNSVIRSYGSTIRMHFA
jgi:hypothetical protein